MVFNLPDIKYLSYFDMAIGRFRKQQMYFKDYYVDILNNNIIQYVLRKKFITICQDTQ